MEETQLETGFFSADSVERDLAVEMAQGAGTQNRLCGQAGTPLRRDQVPALRNIEGDFRLLDIQLPHLRKRYGALGGRQLFLSRKPCLHLLYAEIFDSEDYLGKHDIRFFRLHGRTRFLCAQNNEGQKQRSSSTQQSFHQRRPPSSSFFASSVHWEPAKCCSSLPTSSRTSVIFPARYIISAAR